MVRKTQGDRRLINAIPRASHPQGNEDVTQRRLRRLWECGLLARWAFPGLRTHSEFYYYLDSRQPLDLLPERRRLDIHPHMLEGFGATARRTMPAQHSPLTDQLKGTDLRRPALSAIIRRIGYNQLGIRRMASLPQFPLCAATSGRWDEYQNMCISDNAAIQELAEGLIFSEHLSENLMAGRNILLKGRDRVVGLGTGLLTKVNLNVGMSDLKELETEREKVRLISSLGYRPDAMMDLSIVRTQIPLYRFILDTFGGPVGTLPHYLCYSPGRGIDQHLMLEEIHRQAEAGVSWMTLHLVVRRDLYERARQTRLTPVVARGGGILIDDMYLNDRSEGVLSLLFDRILDILKKYAVVLSLGTTFRPATVMDALDNVHREELNSQEVYLNEARRRGVQVMMEGLGHATLAKIAEFVTRLRSQYAIPFVPLGPLPTDAAIGEDHVASAIGSAYMAWLGGADMINCVTREEHTGKVPSQDSIVEGLRAARIAAHSVNISRFPKMEVAEGRTEQVRAANYTCVVDGGLFSESSKLRFSMGCSRCGNECPLLVNHRRDTAMGMPQPRSGSTTPSAFD